MKLIWQAISILAVAHVLLFFGFLGFLLLTGRLDRERLQKTMALYAMSVEQQHQLQADKLKAEAQTKAKAEREARLVGLPGADAEVVTVGANNPTEVARKQIQTDLDRLNALKRNLDAQMALVTQARAKFEADKKAFAEQQQQLQASRQSEGFQKAVDLYNTLPPRTTKDLFVSMLQSPADAGQPGPVEQVVAYLDSMEPRRAANVIKQFKTPAEIAMARQLMEQLRSRGSDLAMMAEPSS